MDCDEIETEATRKMKENTADEMFEELGFKKSITEYKNIEYCKEEYKIIMFLTKNEAVSISYYFNVSELNITMQELQAINKKCEELGWV